MNFSERKLKKSENSTTGVINGLKAGAGTYGAVSLAAGKSAWIGYPVKDVIRSAAAVEGKAIRGVRLYVRSLSDNAEIYGKKGDILYVDEMWMTTIQAGNTLPDMPNLTDAELLYAPKKVLLWDMESETLGSAGSKASVGNTANRGTQTMTFVANGGLKADGSKPAIGKSLEWKVTEPSEAKDKNDKFTYQTQNVTLSGGSLTNTKLEENDIIWFRIKADIDIPSGLLVQFITTDSTSAKNFTAGKIAATASDLLEPQRYLALKQDMTYVKQRLGEPGAVHRVAELIMKTAKEQA